MLLVSSLREQTKGKEWGSTTEGRGNKSTHSLFSTSTAGEGSLVLDLASSPSSPSNVSSSSSSSSISDCSAHQRPACSAKTPVKATLQIRCEDARSSVGMRRDFGNGGKGIGIEFTGGSGAEDEDEAKGRGRVVKFAKKSVHRGMRSDSLTCGGRHA